MLKIKIKKINEDAIIPHYAHDEDAGMDLYSVVDHVLKPFERRAIPTGFIIAIPKGYEGQVRPKSGLALKYGITMPNSPGTIDSTYRGELKVLMVNLGKKNYLIKKGEKIAQIIFSKVEKASIKEVSELDDTSRGEGGFGSTGLKNNKV